MKLQVSLLTLVAWVVASLVWRYRCWTGRGLTGLPFF